MYSQTVSQGFEMEHIVPYFQPVMDLSCGSVLNYECLARQLADNEQAFLPSEFIQIVERERCHGELTRVIFHRSAEYFRHMNVPWSINLSRQDISDLSLIGFLQDYLRFYPFPQRVILEMNATVVQSSPNEFKAFLLMCKVLDIQLFIDNVDHEKVDVEQILALPVDGIKIDGNMVRQIRSSQQVSNRVRKLKKIAMEKDIRVMAQHIEDKNTLDAVESLGIRYGQGFYLCAPGSQALN